MHKKMLMPVLDKMGAATARPLCPLSASLCACFCYRGPAAEGGKDGTLRQLVFCSLWSPRGRTHVLWGGCVACWPAGASLGSPATALPVWQLSFVSELLSHPSYCGRASTLRRADFERKSFWWLGAVNSCCLLSGMPCITFCQDLLGWVPYPYPGYLLSSLKAGVLPCYIMNDMMLTALILYRNAHLSGFCFRSRGLALFLLKIMWFCPWTGTILGESGPCEIHYFLHGCAATKRGKDLKFQCLTLPLTWHSYLMAFFYTLSSPTCFFSKTIP